MAVPAPPKKRLHPPRRNEMLQPPLRRHRLPLPHAHLLANPVSLEPTLPFTPLDPFVDAQTGYGARGDYAGGYARDFGVHDCKVCETVGVCGYCALDWVDEWDGGVVDFDDGEEVG